MTLFVIDTNAIFHDFFFQRTLLNVVVQAKRAGDEVVIPDVVLDEHINQYREQVAANVAKIRSGWTSLEKLRVASAHADAPSVDDAMSGYRQRVTETLKELGIRRHPYPNVTHPVLVARDLLRRKPFTSEGKGYRDALLWESVLELVASGGDVVLVTNNSDDFGKNLHPDLVADLERRGFAKRVVLEPDLDSVVANHLQARLAEADALAKQLATGTHPQLNLQQWVNENARALLTEHRIAPRTVGLSNDHHEVMPLEITNVAPPVVAIVNRLPTGSFVVNAEVLITAEFEAVFVDSDATDVPEPPLRRHLGEFDDDHVFVESTWAEVRVHFSLILDASGTVTSSQQLFVMATPNREFVE